MAMETPGFANQASSYSAEVARRAVFSAYARTAANTPGILSGGLLSTADMQLTAPGSGLSVNVSTGEAIVGGNEGGTQGGYYARNASTTNLVISTANPTNPRIDTIALTIADNGYTEPTGVSGNAAVLQVVVGTASSGANLTNLTGKAALPASSLLLGYCLVPALATNIITADLASVASVVRPGGSQIASIFNSGAITVTTGTGAVACATVDFDSSTMTSTANLLTVKAAGYYAIEGVVQWPANSAGSVRGAFIFYNGTLRLRSQTFLPNMASVSQPTVVHAYDLINAAMGDTFSLGGIQDTGSNVNTAGVGTCGIRAVRVG